MKEIPHIAVIGAGVIGCRHLQGLSRINRLISISVVDPNQQSLDIANQRYSEQLLKQYNHTITYRKSISELHAQVDVAIIATNSDIRRDVIERLINQVPVRYFILEKVAFQSDEDFEAILKLLKEHNSKAWVNCVRRMYPLYNEMREKLRQEKHITIEWDLGPSTGGESGLGCNAIHLIDLFSFLTGEKNITLDISELEKIIFPSRKPNCVEFSGYLTAATIRGDRLRMIHERGTQRPSMHIISGQRVRYLIFQTTAEIFCQEETSAWMLKRSKYDAPLQSEITHLVVQDILDRGESRLTALGESYVLHKPMLEGFSSHLQNITGRRYKSCPIT